jgi:hypothetical protein
LSIHLPYKKCSSRRRKTIEVRNKEKKKRSCIFAWDWGSIAVLQPTPSALSGITECATKPSSFVEVLLFAWAGIIAMNHHIQPEIVRKSCGKIKLSPRKYLFKFRKRIFFKKTKAEIIQRRPMQLTFLINGKMYINKNDREDMLLAKISI